MTVRETDETKAETVVSHTLLQDSLKCQGSLCLRVEMHTEIDKKSFNIKLKDESSALLAMTAFILISLQLRGVPRGSEDIWIMEGFRLCLLFELEICTSKGEQLKCLSAFSPNSTWDLPIKSKVLLAAHFDKICYGIWHVFPSQRQLICRCEMFFRENRRDQPEKWEILHLGHVLMITNMHYTLEMKF